MSQLISSFPIGTIFYQSGKGYPTHIATRGCTYIDISTGSMYINKDGIVDWEEIVDNPVDYIHFNTGQTTTYNGGDLFWDDTENALSYKPYTLNNDVTINLGQENVLRVYNNSGAQINNGQVCIITGTTGDFSTIGLAIGYDGATTYIVDGVATHDIPNNTYGFITRFGHVHDIDLSSFSNGEYLYLSQTTAGGLAQFEDLSFTGRVSQVGYVISAATNGILEVSIINESYVSDITALQTNILTGVNSSNGVFDFSGLTKTSSTTFSVSPAKGWIIDNTTNPIDPSISYIDYSGATNIDSPYRTTDTITYILLTTGATLTLQPTVPTPQQRRENIFLGKIGHPDKANFSIAFPVVDFDASPVSQLRDMFIPIPLINNGIYPYANADLTFNNTAGELYGLGINYPTNKLSPNTLSVSAQTPVTFQYRTQTGGTLTLTTNVDPAYYDDGGVRTLISAPAKQATNQRVFLLQDGSFRIQYGQTVYTDLATALSSIQTETFTTFPNWRDNGILIAILSLRSDTTDLSDPNYAKFLFVSKFGETVGAAGGLSTTNLQQAYENSSTPEITINSTLDGLSIKNGTGNADNITNLLEGVNAAGDTTSFIKADGSFSGLTYYGDGSNLTGISGGSSLSGLTDVTISSGVTTGSTLMYNGSVWNDVDPFDYFDAKPLTYQKHVNMPVFGGSAINNIEGVAFVAAGATARSWADTDDISRTQRLGLTVSATGNLAQIRQIQNYISINGGFDITSAFNMAENATDTAIRFYIGLTTLTIFSNVEPDTLTNVVGFCRLSTSDNLHLVYNDASGTATTVDLGVNFPANTESADRYNIRIKTVSTGVYVQIDRVGTSYSYSTIITTDIPTSSTGLRFGAYIVDTTGSSVTTGFDWYGTYVKI